MSSRPWCFVETPPGTYSEDLRQALVVHSLWSRIASGNRSALPGEPLVPRADLSRYFWVMANLCRKV
jgi:hypothetical protein